MQKQLNALIKAEEEEEFPEDEGRAPRENGDPEEEGEDEEEEGDGEFGMYSVENASQFPQLEQMQKQISKLTAAVQGKFDMQKMVQVETEGRLRKMGFREETSLTRPTLKRYEDSIGIDGTTPIAKTADSPDAMVDQMLNMSYKDLRVLQEKIESGETEGIPQEFLN